MSSRLDGLCSHQPLSMTFLSIRRTTLFAIRFCNLLTCLFHPDASPLLCASFLILVNPRIALTPYISRKFRNMSWPTGVSIDSGWNCTPSTASSRCRTAMITPDSLSAVTSRHSGKPSRWMASE